MTPMELMTVLAEPALLDGARIEPGDRVRLAVRRKDNELILLRIDKLK